MKFLVKVFRDLIDGKIGTIYTLILYTGFTITFSIIFLFFSEISNIPVSIHKYTQSIYTIFLITICVFAIRGIVKFNRTVLESRGPIATFVASAYMVVVCILGVLWSELVLSSAHVMSDLEERWRAEAIEGDARCRESFANGQWQTASDMCWTAVRHYHYFPEGKAAELRVLLCASLLYSKHWDLELLRRRCTAALESDPDNTYGLLGMGYISFQTGDLAVSQDRYNSALENDPKPAMGYFLRGKLHAEMGRDDLAASDYRLAADIWRISADTGHFGSQLYLGIIYAGGFGLQKDTPTAVNWWRKAAKHNYAPALYQLGQIYRDGEKTNGDAVAAFNYIAAAAELGHAEAQNALGEMLDTGLGVPIDHHQAVQWYRKAAIQDLPSAHFNIGFAYEIGRGARQDTESAGLQYALAAAMGHQEAIPNLIDIAESGVGSAALRLGRIYTHGYAVQADLSEASKWYYVASRLNEWQAKKEQADLLKMMTTEEVSRAIELYEKWKAEHLSK